MLWPLLLMALGFKLYYVTLLLMRMRSELLAARIQNLQMTLLDEGRAEALTMRGGVAANTKA